MVILIIILMNTTTTTTTVIIIRISNNNNNARIYLNSFEPVRSAAGLVANYMKPDTNRDYIYYNIKFCSYHPTSCIHCRHTRLSFVSFLLFVLTEYFSTTKKIKIK